MPINYNHPSRKPQSVSVQTKPGERVVLKRGESINLTTHVVTRNG